MSEILDALHMDFRAPLLLVPAMLLLAGLMAVGCDDNAFEAFNPEGERLGPYSVVGYLDPIADTQFVRVEALQDSSLAGGDVPDVRVATTHFETGETTVWQDTLVEVGADVFVPLFYTTASVAPEARYRFTAERTADGAASRADVATPKRLEPLNVLSSAVPAVPPVITPPGPMNGPDEVSIAMRGADDIGGVRADYDYLFCFPTPVGLECQRFRNTFFHLGRVRRVAEGRFQAIIPWRADIESTLANEEFFAGFYRFRVTIAGVSETWPDYGMSIDSVLATQPPPSAEVSNIENGTGFLGGAALRTVDVPLTTEGANAQR